MIPLLGQNKEDQSARRNEEGQERGPTRGLNHLPAVANCELDDARCHFPRRPPEPIEVFRRVKRCSLKVCQCQGLALGAQVQARERIETARRAVEMGIWRSVHSCGWEREKVENVERVVENETWAVEQVEDVHLQFYRRFPPRNPDGLRE
jgi:hypothetical protein